MAHVAYVNGRYLPHKQAAVSIDDRATQFSDAIYEVVCIWNGRPVDYAPHLARLERSASELGMPKPAAKGLTVISREVVRRNRVDRGILYIQISRGIAPRAHGFPTAARPSVIVTARSGAGPSDTVAAQGVKVVTAEDQRWGRRDIKATSLLPNVLARQTASTAKAFEALLYDANGIVTEASASNAWMVAMDGTIVTHPLGPEILGGVTRATVIALAREAGRIVVERPFTMQEARSARELFLTGTTTFVMPVVQMDEQAIANGMPGSIALDLRQRYAAYVDPADRIGRRMDDVIKNEVTAITPEMDVAAAIANLPHPRAILFDWDNTLVDTWPCIGKATNITLTTMGHTPWTETQIRERVAGSLRDTFPKIYGDRWEEAREVYYRAFEAVHLETLAPLPGAEALLAAAAERRLVLGVVSNKTGRYLRQEIAHLGWEHYFARAVGAQDAARDKPAPDPIFAALEGTGVTAGPAVWFIGDAGIDIECGRAAGCTTILLHGGAAGGPLTPHQRAKDCAMLARFISHQIATPNP